jgi:hypothetical protein
MQLITYRPYNLSMDRGGTTASNSFLLLCQWLLRPSYGSVAMETCLRGTQPLRKSESDISIFHYSRFQPHVTVLLRSLEMPAD